MNAFDVSRWLWDFYFLATVLLATVLVVELFVKQPARRMALSWATAIGSIALVALTALPNWSKISLGSAASPPVEIQQRRSITVEPISSVEESVIAAQPVRQVPLAEDVPVGKAEIEIDWQLVAYYLMAAGSMITICWLALGAWQVRRLRAEAERCPPEIDSLFKEFGGSRDIQLAVSPRLPVAVALGLLKPCVLLPKEMVSGASVNQIRSVLAHELAHVAHHDLWLLMLLRGLMVILWPHPLFWMLRRRVRIDQELLADAAAAELSSRTNYAADLIALARAAAHDRVPRLASSVGLWERPSQLAERIALLLDDKLMILRNCSRGWRFGSAATLILIALTLSMITLSPRRAESQATPPETSLSPQVISDSRFDELVAQSNTTEGFADGVGELVVAAIRPSQLPFVSEKRLAAIRYDFVLLVNEFAPQGLSAEPKAEILTGLRDHAQQHLQLPDRPVTEDRDLNGFYLNFYDRIKTLKWELWMVFTRKPITTDELKIRDVQRNWMRNRIREEPKHRIEAFTHQKALDELEARFADPLCIPLATPMRDEEFANFQKSIGELSEPAGPESTAVGQPANESDLPFLVHHFVWEAMQAKWVGPRAEYRFPKFDDDDVVSSGAGGGFINLGFASNRDNAGSSRSIDCLEDGNRAIDAATGNVVHIGEGSRSNGTNDDADISYSADKQSLVALNGARLLLLEAKNWMEADLITTEKLKAELAASGTDEVDLAKCYQQQREAFLARFRNGAAGPEFRPAPTAEEALTLWDARRGFRGPFVGVLTGEGRISVAEVDDVTFRPDWKPRSIAVRTRVREELAEADINQAKSSKRDKLAFGNFTQLNPELLQKVANIDSPIRSATVFDSTIVEVGHPSIELTGEPGPSTPLAQIAPQSQLVGKGFTQLFDNSALAVREQSQSAKPPKLLYLTWQGDNVELNGESKLTLWDAGGEVLSSDESASFLKELTETVHLQKSDDTLPPLVMFFRWDKEVNSPVIATAVTEHGVSITTSFARTSDEGDLCVAVLTAPRSEVNTWPNAVSLNVRYATENSRVFKSIDSISDSPLEIADGVQWYLDSSKAKEFGPQTRLVKTPNKTAGVLEIRDDVRQGLTNYSANVFLKGQDRPLRSLYSTIVTMAGKNNGIDVSEPFDGKDQIERVEFIRQQYRMLKIDKVPLKIDLLPKFDKNASGVMSPDRRYISISPDGAKIIERKDRDAYENGIFVPNPEARR